MSGSSPSSPSSIPWHWNTATVSLNSQSAALFLPIRAGMLDLTNRSRAPLFPPIGARLLYTANGSRAALFSQQETRVGLPDLANRSRAEGPMRHRPAFSTNQLFAFTCLAQDCSRGRCAACEGRTEPGHLSDQWDLTLLFPPISCSLLPVQPRIVAERGAQLEKVGQNKDFFATNEISRCFFH